jgi:hypothetical protein
MSNVNEDLLHQHLLVLSWWNKQEEAGHDIVGDVESDLIGAANYFLSRMQAAEQAVLNMQEALKKPPLTDDEKFQKGYVQAVEDYHSYLPEGTYERLTGRWPNDSWAGRRKA